MIPLHTLRVNDPPPSPPFIDTCACNIPTARRIPPPLYHLFSLLRSPPLPRRYHLTFSYSDTNDDAPRQTRLSFEETRRRSPFFLAVVISIGARSLSRFDTFHVTFREALRLARQTFLPDAWMYDSELGLGNPGDRPPTLYPAYAPTWPTPAMNRAPHIVDTTEFEPRLSTLSLKALVLLGLYHAMPELLMHAWIAGYRFIWPSSLLEYEHMTNEERSSLRGLRSINIARVGVITCLWHSL